MQDREINHYFKQVVKGAAPEALAKLGQALLALQAERGGDANAAAAPKLRAAWLAIARALLSSSRGELSPAQQLFLFTGALCDELELSQPGGGKQLVQLLPRELYQALLIEFELLLKASRRLHSGSRTPAAGADDVEAHEAAALQAHAQVLHDLPAVLMPLQRLYLLGSGELDPYDPERSSRTPGASLRGKRRDLTAERHELEHSVGLLRSAQAQLTSDARVMMDLLRSERLAPALREIGELNRLAAELLAAAQTDYTHLAGYELSSLQQEVGSAELRHLKNELKDCFEGLCADAAHLRECMLRARQQAFRIAHAGSDQQSRSSYDGGPVLLSGEGLARALADTEAMHRSAEASLVSEYRGSLSGSSVLISEQLARLEDPLRDSFATPWNVASALLKLDSLHPNCFPHDAEGWPRLPPIVIVPGVNISRWLDDRFLLGFVATDAPRVGPSLSLSALEQSVLRLFGQYLARGDIFNYRGERVSDSFMAEYAGEIEQKAVRKFTGQEKKLTIVGTTNEKDGASREDAVRDYCDFIFAVFNGQPIPKRISPRKVGVLLKYCVVGSEEQTATLALKLLPREQNLQVRETMLKLAGRDRARLIELFRHALENDPQVRSRFRGDLSVALQEVLPREVLDEINDLGLLGRRDSAAQPVPAGQAPEPPRPDEPHKYFDL
ncbi:hypothetical protein IT575_01725 [bacterium]|nr:hypothetical protein [bacterium]